jgi:hypothetical protein
MISQESQQTNAKSAPDNHVENQSNNNQHALKMELIMVLYQDNPTKWNLAPVQVCNEGQRMPKSLFSLFFKETMNATSFPKTMSSDNNSAPIIGITDKNSGITTLNLTSAESQPSKNYSRESNFVVNETIPVVEGTKLPSIISAELNATFFQTNSEINDINSKISSSNHT